MKEDLVELLRCPRCASGELRLEAECFDSYGIEKGCLACRSCGSSFDIDHGVPDLLVPSTSRQWAEEQRAMEAAWYDTEAGGLDPSWPEAEVHEALLSLPDGLEGGLYTEDGLFRNLKASAVGFVSLLELMDLGGTESILDIGAGTCYTTREFAKRGCRAVAIEIWPDCLRSGRVFIEHEGIHFERVLADMNRMPFGDGCFDIVFANQSIHHCEDLEGAFREFGRALKPGGRMFFIEPIIGILNSRGRQAMHEVKASQLGINEQTYSGLEYQRAARGAGLRLRFVLLESAIEKKLKDPRVQETYRGVHHRVFLSLMKRDLFRKSMLSLAKPAIVTFRPFCVAMVCRHV